MSLSENLKFLRKKKDLTQHELALRLGIKRGILGAYEEGRAEPRIQSLLLFSRFFEVSIDRLVSEDLSKGGVDGDYAGARLRVLPVAVERDADRELCTIVPVKAAAGYLKGYGDVEYVSSLPRFSLPFPETAGARTYRLFQIRGDSMLPVPDKAYIICEYVQDWSTIKFGESHVLLTTDEGIAFKRVYPLPQTGQLELVSDNRAYKPYRIAYEQLLEVWKARGMVHFDLDSLGQQTTPGLEALTEAVKRLETRIEELGAK